MTIDRQINSSKRGLLQMGGAPQPRYWRWAEPSLDIRASSSSAGRVLVNLQLVGGHASNSMIIPLDDPPYAPTETVFSYSSPAECMTPSECSNRVCIAPGYTWSV